MKLKIQKKALNSKKPKMRVLVITGGNSDEREISLLSAENVIEALKKKSHAVQTIDFNKGFPEILISAKRNDVIFPVLHGPEGESGILQKVLEDSHIKFIGSGSEACENGWNKIKFKNFCKKLDVKTASWLILNNSNRKSLYDIKKPFVIKPIDNGSSVDVYICKSQEDLKKINLENLLKKYNRLLVEDYIAGIEITAGILDNIALPVIEIIPPPGEWFSYENKYSGKTQEIPNAPSLSLNQQEKVKKIALTIHNILGCKDFSRSDFIFSNGNFYALEINTIPGLTKQSLLPKAASAAGFSFKEVTDILINNAFKN